MNIHFQRKTAIFQSQLIYLLNLRAHLKMSHFESTNVIPYGNIIWHINRYWLQRVRLETELIWPNFASTGSSWHYEVDLEVPETIYLLSRSSRILSLRNSCLINALSCAAPKFRSLAHPALGSRFLCKLGIRFPSSHLSACHPPTTHITFFAAPTFSSI